MKNNRKGLSVRTMIAIMGGVTLVLIAIFGLSYYRNYQRKQEIQQARIEREKQRKRDEIHFHTQVKEDLKKAQDTVPVDKAKRKVSKAISLGFRAISVTKSISGNTMSLNTLSDSFKSDLSAIYKSTDALQDFNDAVNLSSDEGVVVHGDHGHMRSEKTPKVGSRYIVDSCVIEQDDEGTQDDNYRFNVNLKYHPVGFTSLKASLTFVVDSFSGKISSVESNSIN